MWFQRIQTRTKVGCKNGGLSKGLNLQFTAKYCPRQESKTLQNSVNTVSVSRTEQKVFPAKIGLMVGDSTKLDQLLLL